MITVLGLDYSPIVNTKCLLITYTKNSCITCARVSVIAVSSEGWLQRKLSLWRYMLEEEKIGAPRRALQKGWVSCYMRSFPSKATAVVLYCTAVMSSQRETSCTSPLSSSSLTSGPAPFRVHTGRALADCERKPPGKWDYEVFFMT
jgi:hypothetical protein